MKLPSSLQELTFGHFGAKLVADWKCLRSPYVFIIEVVVSKDFRNFSQFHLFFLVGKISILIHFDSCVLNRVWNSKGEEDMTCLCGSFLFFNSIGIWLKNLSCLCGSFFITDVQLNNMTECCNDKFDERTNERNTLKTNRTLVDKKIHPWGALLTPRLRKDFSNYCVSVVFIVLFFPINHPKNKMTTCNIFNYQKITWISQKLKTKQLIRYDSLT